MTTSTKYGFLFIVIISLTGCATLTRGKYQRITVHTSPPGARCDFYNDQGRWSMTDTPNSVTIKRSASALHIACHKPGYAVTDKMMRPKVHKTKEGKSTVSYTSTINLILQPEDKHWQHNSGHHNSRSHHQGYDVRSAKY